MATAAATHSTQATAHRPTLFLAFELGVNTWGFLHIPRQGIFQRSPRVLRGCWLKHSYHFCAYSSTICVSVRFR
jgi:hypothetical protein